jgi:hypothetical protein
MISRKELIDMIASEAVEEFGVGQETIKRNDSYNSQLPPINYDLRLVKYSDGRMEWKE